MTIRLIGVTELAELFGVNTGTVSNWVKRGQLEPDYITGSGNPFWDNDPDALMVWYETERPSAARLKKKAS